MSITINNVREYTTYNEAGKPQILVEVEYLTDKNFRGRISVEKAKATEEEIIKRIKNDAKLSSSLIGLEIKG